MNAFLTIILLVISNVFMTMAWYGHLKFKEWGWFEQAGVSTLILISWGLAFFEYCFQVPANRIGSQEHGGSFGLFELKIIQEVVTLVVFTFFAVYIFKTDTLRLNHLIGFGFLVLAVYFIFKK